MKYELIKSLFYLSCLWSSLQICISCWEHSWRTSILYLWTASSKVDASVRCKLNFLETPNFRIAARTIGKPCRPIDNLRKYLIKLSSFFKPTSTASFDSEHSREWNTCFMLSPVPTKLNLNFLPPKIRLARAGFSLRQVFQKNS